MTAYSERFNQAVAAVLGGATVVTGNTRSARAVKQAAEGEQRRLGRAVWSTPDVLPFGAFCGRLHAAAMVAGHSRRLLLSPEQELQLWRSIVEHSPSSRELLMTDAAAELARRSLRTAAEYRVRLAEASMSATNETRAFSGWAAEFLDQLEERGWSCESRLAQELIPLLPHLALPARLYVYLSEVAPATDGLLRALEDNGVVVERSSTEAPGESAPSVQRVSFAGEPEELAGAAQWARRQVERNPQARVGVVFFDLSRRRAAVERAFRGVLDAGRLLGASASSPFEIAAPLALADYPPVRCALRWLSLPVRALSFNEFAGMMTSPYLGGDPLQAARVVRMLRKDARREVAFAEVQGWLRQHASLVPVLRSAVDPMPSHAEFDSVQPAAAWVGFARALLGALRWPGAETLSSEEYQCTARWSELLSSMSALSLTGWRGTYSNFVQRLERMAAAQNFLPESEGAPVQIMDAAEAGGSLFDALWIGAASDDLWPAFEQPSPLLPISLLRDAGFPLSGTPAGEARAERATARLLQSAPEVCVSLALRTADEREQRWSPAFESLPTPGAPEALPTPLPLRFAPAALEDVNDVQAPALDAARETASGGTWLLADQSNCPFRAFAIRRLYAEQERGPNEELAATDRGKVVEKALELLWKELQTSEGLKRADLDAQIARAVDEAMHVLPARGDQWTLRFRQLERERTVAVVREWMELEKQRPAFRVLEHQKELRITLGGLPLHGFIDRLDEVNGRALVLDYKTGAETSPSAWQVPRPRLPQLPLYAVARQREHHDAAGVAFAVVWRNEAAFKSFLAEDNLLPGRRPHDFAHEDWSVYLPRWDEELERIAASFVAGEAAVDPKVPPGLSHSPCGNCHLSSLCRVRAAEEDEDEGAGDE